MQIWLCESNPMTLSRRSFLNSIAVTSLATSSASGLARATEPLYETGNLGPRQESTQSPLRTAKTSNVRLGLAAYSFREHFEFMRGKPQTPRGDKKVDMFSFIDYCAEHRCGAELTSYFFPPDADEAYFLKVKRHAFLNGVPIVGTAIGNNFTIGRGEKLDQQIADAKKWIDRAAIMGAPHVRFFAGTRKQLEASPDGMKIAIESLQECVDYASKRGIVIGVENHGQLTAQQVLKVVGGVKSDWFGVNLDTGNFISDDPYRDLELCFPHAVNVQFKIKMKSPAGEKYDADLPRIGTIIDNANYRGFVVLESEEEKPFDHVPMWLEKIRETLGC